MLTLIRVNNNQKKCVVLLSERSYDEVKDSFFGKLLGWLEFSHLQAGVNGHHGFWREIQEWWSLPCEDRGTCSAFCAAEYLSGRTLFSAKGNTAQVHALGKW